MKLFTKYNQVNILATVIIFLLGCLAFYFVTSHVLLKQLDGVLDTEDAEVSLYTKQHDTLPEIVNTDDQQVYFKEVAAPIIGRTYTSKKLWNENEHVTEWTRQLVFGLTATGKNYQVTVNKSQEESESFLKLMVVIATAMIALILLAGNVINRIILKNLWHPFYQTINRIGKYHLHSQEPLKLPTTGTDEFTLLNESLNNMTERLGNEYRALKEFTANAAHEMQTPLAVISGNTESLMQDENVLIHHHKAISTIEEASKRLSKLNQSLLLLTKIENHRFEIDEHVDWDVLLHKRLNELSELIVSQNLATKLNIIPANTIFHQHLADILISNLVSNAIRYNYEGGLIEIELDEKMLRVANTSSIPSLDAEKIFSRFYRHPETKADGSGLGLSIVKQICNIAGYTLSYEYTNNMHVFRIRFAK